jgi:hypothetical protein
VSAVVLFTLGTTLIFSCTRRFSCDCNYVQLEYIDSVFKDSNNQDSLGIFIKRSDEKYNSSIAYTSKKLANEECDERGRSLDLDTLHVDISCSISKE